MVEEKSEIKRQGFGFSGTFTFYLATLLILDGVIFSTVIR